MYVTPEAIVESNVRLAAKGSAKLKLPREGPNEANPTNHLDPACLRRTAHLAVQRTLGILSERRIGSAADNSHSRNAGYLNSSPSDYSTRLSRLPKVGAKSTHENFGFLRNWLKTAPIENISGPRRLSPVGYQLHLSL